MHSNAFSHVFFRPCWSGRLEIDFKFVSARLTLDHPCHLARTTFQTRCKKKTAWRIIEAWHTWRLGRYNAYSPLSHGRWLMFWVLIRSDHVRVCIIGISYIYYGIIRYVLIDCDVLRCLKLMAKLGLKIKRTSFLAQVGAAGRRTCCSVPVQCLELRFGMIRWCKKMEGLENHIALDSLDVRSFGWHLWNFSMSVCCCPELSLCSHGIKLDET